MLWRDGYGAIPRSARRDDSPGPFIPGPENVKTFPDRWRRAPVWIFVFIVLILSLPPESRLHVSLGMHYIHLNQDEIQHLKQ